MNYSAELQDIRLIHKIQFCYMLATSDEKKKILSSIYKNMKA